MSRDLTPRELYSLERTNIQNGNGSLWDFMENISFSYEGKTTPLYSSESIASRKKYPLLGRLYNDFDQIYYYLSQIENGLKLLDRYEKELNAYITTGAGNRNSFLIQWFEGKLDPDFYYSAHNDDLFFASVQDELGKLYSFDPKQENCCWFSLSEDKCISVWAYPDGKHPDQLLMKLEQRGEDGSMGPHCEVLIDESYATGSLSQKDIRRCLREVYKDAGLGAIAQSASLELSNKVLSVFRLNKRSLSEQIQSAAVRQPDSHNEVKDPSKGTPAPSNESRF